MNILAHEFTPTQRQVLDRYTWFLGSLTPTFNNISLVFERCTNNGHQRAVLSKDSRLNNAPFNERYLQAFAGRTAQARRVCSAYVADLETFTRESQEITRQLSRKEPLALVDFKLYSLSRSATWQLFAPQNVPDLIHELALRFFELRADLRQLKYTVAEVYEESFGLHSVFTKAMDHRSCACHPQPSVAQELFRENRTAPAWDIAYSSQDASVRAVEYKADIAALFNRFASVNSQMNLFVEDMYRRMDEVINELLQAKTVVRLGDLNFRMTAVMDNANECMAMLDHFEGWLRK